MELKDYLKVIKKNKKTIAGIAAATTIAAWIFSVSAPDKYETSVSLLLKKSGTQPTDEFKYDGYYALESGKIIADNIEKLLQSPQIVEEIYSRSAVDPEFKNIKSYKKKFTAHKMSNMYVEVSFEAKSMEDAGKLSDSLVQTIRQKTEEMGQGSENEIAFAIEDSRPIIVKSRPQAGLNALIGLISGTFLGILIAFFKEYLS